jgi:DNA repair protein RadC
MPDARERALRNGIEALSDQDLLALVLETGTREHGVVALASHLIESEVGLIGLSRSTPHGLACRGLGVAKAVRVAAAFELGRRAQAKALALSPMRVVGYEEVVAWARPRLATLDHEEVWLLVLNAKNAMKSARRIAQGGAHGCALSAKDILGPALRDAASAIVLVHNHPSGDPTPSEEDVLMTRSISAACEVVGISLLDHVVVAREGSSSLFESGEF